jgi:hypothetical protein
MFTSVWFIAAAALVTRLAFAWDQQAKIPHAALATVPFDQETGNIALALSQGHGFANLFRKDTGPTAWLAPVYPSLLSVIFRLFGPLTLASFFAAVLLNAIFSAAATFPLYAMARRVAGLPVAAASGWIWVFLPSGVMMPFEWIWDTSLSVVLAVTLVWATIIRIHTIGRLARLWFTVGLCFAHESCSGDRATISLWLGLLSSRLLVQARDTHPGRLVGDHRRVLRPLDNSKSPASPPRDSNPLQPPLRTVDREQRHF